ncbi:restriction endonuclease S subunit [Salinibacter ruber]|nr:restriction endonuclease S subunit [Salinibacter ruber]
MKHIKRQTLKDHSIGLPPLDEQRAIATSLDRETGRIDTLIEKKERLIDLLEEKRTALISRVVTKGLDRDVKMKDSGVEWVGEIPAHWDTAKLKFLSESLQTGPFGSQLHSEEYITGGTPVINPSHLVGGKIKPDEEVTVDSETKERIVRHELAAGDLVFARRGELGRNALVTENEEGWLCGTGSIRLRPNRKSVDPPYLSWVCSTRGVAEWFVLKSVGSTMDNLNTDVLGALIVPVPPLSEQRRIARHIRKRISNLDTLIDVIQGGIGNLQEYRTALISAAVTGQIDVREEIPAVPAE